MTPSRRRFLLAIGLVAGARRLPAQDAAPAPQAGGGEAGRLYDATRLGRARERTAQFDNEERVKLLELRLKCPCPCSLDVFTCRTTDFTCTYSPERHREVVGLLQAGKSDAEVIAHFVGKDGEKALMAPPRQGFNLAGYLVPGIALLTAGSLLAWYLVRRRGATIVPVGDVAGAAPAAGAPPAGGSSEELARLERELRSLDV
ncbi:MAG: cytochrome c-type biogenesis protein CcmH [Gemmatimonadales bacterium]|nr:cytochrome c-type biogenesis protein CcmH [Gemmatimonadales bacterium]